MLLTLSIVNLMSSSPKSTPHVPNLLDTSNRWHVHDRIWKWLIFGPVPIGSQGIQYGLVHINDVIFEYGSVCFM